MRKNEIEDKLKALTEAYLTQLPERAKEIDQLLEEVVQSGSWGEPGKNIYRLVHSLAGSGASFGFQKLSDSAKALELSLQQCMQRDDFNEEQRQVIMPLLDNLLVSIKEAVRTEVN